MPRLCDARCRGAQGHVCRCWCGGRYHGRGLLALPQMAADFALDAAALGPRFTMKDPGEGARPAVVSAPGRSGRRRRRALPHRPGIAHQAALPL